MEFHPIPMTTLSEIENAAQELDRKEQEELFLFLAQKLRSEGSLPEPKAFDLKTINSWIEQDEADMKAFSNRSKIQ